MASSWWRAHCLRYFRAEFLADYWADYDLDEEEWKNYLHLLSPLGITIDSASFSEEFYNYATVNPMAESKSRAGKYVVISPVSFDIERGWGRENWKQLISFLASRDINVALTGMPSQKDYLEDLASVDKEKTSVFVKMNIPEFGTLMRGAEFFVGIDSFPAHLALASGKHALVMVSPTTYYLKGYSPKKFTIDARNMLPVSKQVDFFDAGKASFTDVRKVVEELIVRR